MRQAALGILLASSALVVGAQVQAQVPVIDFHLDWRPAAAPMRPNGQKIRISLVKINGQMEERGHWRKYYYQALEDMPSVSETLKVAFAKMLTAKGFTVVDDHNASTYSAIIFISEADTAGFFFSGMGETRPLQPGQPWLFKPKSLEMIATCIGAWHKNQTADDDYLAEVEGRSFKHQVRVKRSRKMDPKVKYPFLGFTGSQLMNIPEFVKNATACTEGIVADVLDFYDTKMDQEYVGDIVRKLRP